MRPPSPATETLMSTGSSTPTTADGLTHGPPRPEATWTRALPWPRLLLICADGPQAFTSSALVRGRCHAVRHSRLSLDVRPLLGIRPVHPRTRATVNGLCREWEGLTEGAVCGAVRVRLDAEPAARWSSAEMGTPIGSLFLARQRSGSGGHRGCRAALLPSVMACCRGCCSPVLYAL